MKRLTLVRHAKSSWRDSSLSDRDRPLNGRGKSDAPLMGERLAARGARPSLILTSPAKRARRTAKIVAAKIGYPLEFLQTERGLYLADVSQLLKTIQLQETSFNDLMLFGHNPGLLELVVELTGERIDHFPTCAMAAIECDIEDWTELTADSGKLVFLDYPKRPTA